MPPKAKFTKAEIIEAALNIVRADGYEALTSRALGTYLGSSARPIFTVFKNMEEVQREVMVAADRLYQSHIAQAMAEGRYPPYKASGMAYISFAREERELFRLLFMRDRSGETIVENRESIRPLLELLEKNLGISEDEANMLHLEMWLYAHGIATMLATAYLEWDEEFISRALTDAYVGLTGRYKERNKHDGD